MKKYFVMLFLMILTMTLVGCSEIANPEDYTIDKEVEIVETITFDQAKDEVPDEEPESNYITMVGTMEMSFGTMKMAYNINISLYEKDGEIDGVMNMSAEGNSIVIDIMDGYMYITSSGMAEMKMKAKIPAGEDFDYDEILGAETDAEELLEELLATVDSKNENLKIGYDKKGCLIFDYKENENKMRMVIDKNYPVYLYSEISGTKMEYKFSYDKVDIKHTEGLDSTDY